jgi:hypothetical protein
MQTARMFAVFGLLASGLELLIFYAVSSQAACQSADCMGDAVGAYVALCGLVPLLVITPVLAVVAASAALSNVHYGQPGWSRAFAILRVLSIVGPLAGMAVFIVIVVMSNLPGPPSIFDWSQPTGQLLLNMSALLQLSPIGVCLPVIVWSNLPSTQLIAPPWSAPPLTKGPTRAQFQGQVEAVVSPATRERLQLTYTDDPQRAWFRVGSAWGWVECHGFNHANGTCTSWDVTLPGERAVTIPTSESAFLATIGARA